MKTPHLMNHHSKFCDSSDDVRSFPCLGYLPYIFSLEWLLATILEAKLWENTHLHENLPKVCITIITVARHSYDIYMRYSHSEFLTLATAVWQLPNSRATVKCGPYITSLRSIIHFVIKCQVRYFREKMQKLLDENLNSYSRFLIVSRVRSECIRTLTPPDTYPPGTLTPLHPTASTIKQEFQNPTI